jgi:hypothetical protein
MTLAGLLTFGAVYGAAVASPGPGVTAVVARVLARGLRGAPAFIAGFLVGDLIWFALAATALHALVHAQFRAGKSKGLIARGVARPWALGRRHARAAANLVYQSGKASLLQRRLSRLARLTAPVPPTPLIPLLTPQAAAVPTEQSALK